MNANRTIAAKVSEELRCDAIALAKSSGETLSGVTRAALEEFVARSPEAVVWTAARQMERGELGNVLEEVKEAEAVIKDFRKRAEAEVIAEAKAAKAHKPKKAATKTAKPKKTAVAGTSLVKSAIKASANADLPNSFARRPTRRSATVAKAINASGDTLDMKITRLREVAAAEGVGEHTPTFQKALTQLVNDHEEKK